MIVIWLAEMRGCHWFKSRHVVEDKFHYRVLTI